MMISKSKKMLCARGFKSFLTSIFYKAKKKTFYFYPVINTGTRINEKNKPVLAAIGGSNVVFTE